MLDRHGLETTLIHSAGSSAPMRAVPAVCMSPGYPVHPHRNFFDPVASNDKVPVIRHQLKRDDLDLKTPERLKNHRNERIVVTSTLEQDCPAHCPVHHVKCRAVQAATKPSWH